MLCFKTKPDNTGLCSGYREVAALQSTRSNVDLWTSITI